MLIAGSSPEGTPIVLVNMNPAPRPPRPALRRRNQHLFDRSPIPMISEQSIPGPASQADGKADYFTCLSCAVKAKVQIPPTQDDHCCWAFPPSEKPSKGGLFSDTARIPCDPKLESIFQVQAASVRTMLHLPSRLQAPILQNQHSAQASSLGPNRPQRTHYSFSSSDSGISSYHVEDVENPVPAYFPQSLASPVIAPVMANITLMDSGIDISDHTNDIVKPGHSTESKNVNEDGIVLKYGERPEPR